MVNVLFKSSTKHEDELKVKIREAQKARKTRECKTREQKEVKRGNRDIHTAPPTWFFSALLH